MIIIGVFMPFETKRNFAVLCWTYHAQCVCTNNQQNTLTQLTDDRRTHERTKSRGYFSEYTFFSLNTAFLFWLWQYYYYYCVIIFMIFFYYCMNFFLQFFFSLIPVLSFMQHKMLYAVFVIFTSFPIYIYNSRVVCLYMSISFSIFFVGVASSP